MTFREHKTGSGWSCERVQHIEPAAGSAQRVGFFNIGSGRVLEKIPGSGSGSGRVGVLKYTIGYFRVSFLLSGISGYSWVFPGISGYIGYHLFFWR